MSTDDVTEEQARTLLARAAATIEVDDAPPLVLAGGREVPRRRWPAAVLSAAAVVLVVGGGFAIVDRLDRAPTPDVAEHPPVERAHSFAPDQVPSVLGYDREAAVALLEGRGLVVRVRERRVPCQPSVAIGTTPALGSTVASGDTVELTVNAPRVTVDCVGEPLWSHAWNLLRFARGLDGPPAFAEQVALSVRGGAAETVAGRDLSDPLAWRLCGRGVCHSALGALQELATRVRTLNGEPRTPYLSLNRVPSWCGGAGTLGPTSTTLTVEIPTDGVFCPDTAVSFAIDERGRIAAVELSVPEEERGDGADRARSMPSAARQRTAEQFVSWARGKGTQPAFANRVRNLTPGFVDPWNDHPERREGWSGCSGLGFPDCGIDPVGTVYRSRGAVDLRACGAACRDQRLVAADDAVLLSQPRGDRGAWAVVLWIDAVGEIYAVGLGAPPSP